MHAGELSALLSPPAIITPAMLNSWVNWGPPHPGAGYFKVGQFVCIRGLIKSGVIGSAAFILPAGFRPKERELFATISNFAIGRLDVFPTGEVTPTIGSNIDFCINDFWFVAAG
jgi:hypothetical protein